jgi:hypothetical protein
VIGLLQAILCWIKQIGAMVADALILAINALIASIAALIQGLVLLLPPMPTFPSFAGSDWLGFFVPVSTMAALAVTLVTLYLAFAGIKMVLKIVQAM